MVTDKGMMDRVFCHFGSFWVIFCHLTPLTTQKIKILNQWKKKKKKKKKHLQISFYPSVPQVTVIWCMIPEIWSLTDRIFCHFGLFFAFLPPNNPENQNFEKKKKSMELSSFHTFVPKIVIRWCMVLEIWCMTDGRTDKQMDRWRADRQTEKVA